MSHRKWVCSRLKLCLFSWALVIMLPTFGASASAAELRTTNGGASIAVAATVPFGAQQFGNTDAATASATVTGCTQGPNPVEFWKLALTAGDQITVNWEAAIVSGQSDAIFSIWPVGTTDFSISNAAPALRVAPGSLVSKAESKYTASRTGTYPLSFTDCDPGAPETTVTYDFTVFVRHAIRLFLPPIATVSRTGIISVQVHNPDGVPLTDAHLRLSLVGVLPHAKKLALGSSAAANGKARFRLKLARSLVGKVLRISVVARGAGYVTEASSTRTVRIGE